MKVMWKMQYQIVLELELVGTRSSAVVLFVFSASKYPMLLLYYYYRTNEILNSRLLATHHYYLLNLHL